MPRILHFADAHIDMANYGKHDPETGLPFRVMDFLKSLDVIVDTAIEEKVDLVLFAGDAYKDRNPAPTFQREWGKRVMRLSHAEIPTLLLVGNHDLSPALGRAHALETFHTLEVPFVQMVERPSFFGPEDLHNIPLQVMALPWVSRSGMMAYLDIKASDPQEVYQMMEEKITALINSWWEAADPDLPVVFTGHASVEGAKFGGERTVMLGNDMILPGSLVRNPQLDYVALGHIHKHQDLNPDAHPPVIYPGSIERVDFGEAKEDKFFVIAEVEKGNTSVEWRQLTHIRPFIDRYLKLESQEGITQQLRAALPMPEKMEGAIVRLTLEYPLTWEAMIDEVALREYTESTFEFHLVKRPERDTRIRLPDDRNFGSMPPLEMLEYYWKASHISKADMDVLQELASEVLSNIHEGAGE